MYYDGIIFDLDGTLWTANTNCTIAWNNLLETLDYPERITEAGMNSVSGKPFSECIDILLPGIRDKYTNIEELITLSEKNVISKDGGILYPDLTECINELSLDTNLYIISNCQKWYLLKFFEFSDLIIYFKDWDCHGMSGLPKDIMIKNMVDKHKIEKPVYIGDTMLDKESSEMAEVDFIQLTHGFGNPIDNEIQFANFVSLCVYLTTKK